MKWGDTGEKLGHFIGNMLAVTFMACVGAILVALTVKIITLIF